MFVLTDGADYSDFFNFNFPHGVPLPADEPRPALNVGGAMRLILLRMRVDKIDPPGAGDHPNYPVVHFVGFSRALDGAWDDNADSDLRGSVRMTPEGAVRWTTYSIFNGEERWKSEGVQLGGLRSARGVAGSWFDKHVSVLSLFPLSAVVLIRGQLAETTARMGRAGRRRSGRCRTASPRAMIRR